jgi:hypothetical protein
MPYKPKKAEDVPGKFYDKDLNPLGSGKAIKHLKEGNPVYTETQMKNLRRQRERKIH